MSNSIHIAEQTLLAIRQINRAMDVHSKKLTKAYGLTGPQLIVLKEIERAQGASLSVLSRNISLSLATVSVILDKLEDKKYVERYKGSTDKRTIYVRITDSAREIIDKVPNLLQEDFLIKFEKLKDWEQSLILSSIQRIASMMKVDISEPTSSVYE
ncbi:MAG: MarR family transcriptional regulator [Caedimonadaceae bacterium]|nr:MAG: MarR family transcriptional regulator [Caedimonadaceae bacterium]